MPNAPMTSRPPRPRRRLRAAATAITLGACLAGPAMLGAQAPIPTRLDTTSHAPAPLFTRRDAYIAAGFTVGTIALFPLDRHVALRLQDSTAQANRFFHHAATGLEVFTSPGALAIGGSLYAVGRIGHYQRVADLGLHGTEAIVLATVVTGALKGAAGRARPFVVNDTNPRNFKFGRGFTKDGYTSFPSGHTTTAFAAASAVTEETSRWWPRSTWYIAPVMYGGATLVGLSRMYHNKHWASDVILGAGIGTFSGLKVVQYQHSHPRSRLDRWLLGTTVGPDGAGGALVAWSIPLR
jgi:membrane-associated phospholipid phosphatase